MTDIDFERYRGFFGKRELMIIALAFVATGITNVIGVNLPIDIEPYLALCPVIGLLFGMPGIVGVNLVSLIYNIWKGNPFDLNILDLLSVFIVSYLPYRMWYSIGMERDSRPPVLDSTFNTTKLIFVLLVSSIVYTILYNIIYLFLNGSLTWDIEDLIRLLKVLSFSFLFGMSAILVLRYLGVRFETPRYGGTPDGIRRRVNPHVYDLCLVVGILVPNLVMLASDSMYVTVAMAVMEYALLLVFLMKPIDPALVEERSGKDRCLIERFITIFIIVGLLLCAAAGTLCYLFLSPYETSESLSESVLLIMNIVLLVFFLPSIPILKYIEERITTPVSAISAASGNFVEGHYEESAAEFAATCARYSDMNDEIGDLARSLNKMNEDMGQYIDDIRNLNSQREMYKAELKIAAKIQESIIPHDFECVRGKGITVSGVMEAAKFVGGDFYDFFQVDEDHVCMTIGDVSGKGVPAAIFMAVTKSLIESQTRPGSDPGEILTQVNAGLSNSNEECMFVTCWLGIVELSTGRLEYASAGHNPPILKRRGEPGIELRTKNGLVLGVMEDARYRSNTIVLAEGDSMLLYTDGVTEANDNYGGFFGVEKLISIVDGDGGNPEPTVTDVRDAVAEFTGDSEQFDDITMLMFRYDGGP